MSVWQILGLNAGVIGFAMIVLWLVSMQTKDASIVDIFWGIGFVVVAWVTFAATSGESRSTVLVALTTLWGVRLAAYLAWRNHGKPEDSRYQAMRERHGERFWWVSLLSVFGLQGFVMWLVSLPVQVGQVALNDMKWLNYVGVAIWMIGFFFESIGDYQLARFKSMSNPERKVMDQGLWRYTRHPNYFGNACIWWGLFLVALMPSTLWLAVSPDVMTFLLIKISGVALLEKSLSERSQEYRDYIERTSAFVPWPPSG